MGLTIFFCFLSLYLLLNSSVSQIIEETPHDHKKPGDFQYCEEIAYNLVQAQFLIQKNRVSKDCEGETHQDKAYIPGYNPA